MRGRFGWESQVAFLQKSKNDDDELMSQWWELKDRDEITAFFHPLYIIPVYGHKKIDDMIMVWFCKIWVW